MLLSSSTGRPRRSFGIYRSLPVPPRTSRRKSTQEEVARDAVAHEEEAPGGKVRMTIRVVRGRQDAEALAPRAILREKTS